MPAYRVRVDDPGMVSAHTIEVTARDAGQAEQFAHRFAVIADRKKITGPPHASDLHELAAAHPGTDLLDGETRCAFASPMEA